MLKCQEEKWVLTCADKTGELLTGLVKNGLWFQI
jgi:hypothetical protein